MQGETDEEQFRRGLALQQEGRFAEAVETYLPLTRKALTVKLAVNLGVAYGELGQRDQAIQYLQAVAGHLPGEAEVQRLYASALAEAGRTQEAEATYRAILAAAPGDKAAELALGGLLLSLGRYAEGWPMLEARAALHAGAVPEVNLPYPEWRGEPLAGKSILVWVEQGFGDKIQFARFVNSLKAQGAAKVSLGCNPPLTHLFSTLAGADTLVTVARRQTVTVPAHDYWTRYFSLPGRLGVTLETLPTEPYLSAPADRRARWADFRREARLGGRRVGFVWQASPTGFNAGHKGVPDEVARRLLDLGAVSLHPQDSGAADFADTAAIIETLDLVVSIDTSVAHLAGAMGKPVWTLLPWVKCDWRWLRDRTDSPWYPTMRLYRPTRADDWPAMIDRVIADLA